MYYRQPCEYMTLFESVAQLSCDTFTSLHNAAIILYSILSSVSRKLWMHFMKL